MNKSQYPAGWDERRVSKVLAHYENQTEEEQHNEIQAALKEQKLTSKEYETVVTDIAGRLCALDEGNKEEHRILYGPRNKWPGISGYEHQIDVSVELPKDVLLVECKCWGKFVDVDRFLTFFGRIVDIREQEAKTRGRHLHPVIVTTRGFDAGVEKLADYYKIELQLVQSASEFAVRFKDASFFGVADSGNGDDRVGFLEKRDDEGTLIESNGVHHSR